MTRFFPGFHGVFDISPLSVGRSGVSIQLGSGSFKMVPSSSFSSPSCPIFRRPCLGLTLFPGFARVGNVALCPNTRTLPPSLPVISPSLIGPLSRLVTERFFLRFEVFHRQSPFFPRTDLLPTFCIPTTLEGPNSPF